MTQLRKTFSLHQEISYECTFVDKTPSLNLYNLKGYILHGRKTFNLITNPPFHSGRVLYKN